MAEYKLIKEIIDLSQSKDWETAKKEWSLYQIYFSEAFETCLCGHYPIKEICEIINSKNSNIATVGNCCVNKFLGLESDKIFQSIKRIKADKTKGLNKESIDFVFSKNWINLWEHGFYSDTFRKRKLTERQIKTRESINEKVIKNLNKSKQ